MTMRLFDVQAGFGGAKPGEQPIDTAELLAEMDRITIDRALVRTAPTDLDGDVDRSNQALFASAGRWSDRLLPCPVVVPAAAGDMPPEATQVDGLIAAGASAVVVRPERDRWSLAPWASGALFGALEQRRLPVLCLQPMVTLEQTAGLAERHPQLPLIVGGASYLQLRTLAALLEVFANVYLSTGSNFVVHRGIECLAERVGPRRLLFGTGFPDVEPMMAVTHLMYAEIDEDARRLIGAENLRRLCEEVQR